MNLFRRNSDMLEGTGRFLLVLVAAILATGAGVVWLAWWIGSHLEWMP